MSIDQIRGGVPPIQTATTGARPSPDPARKPDSGSKTDEVQISQEALSLSQADAKAKEIRAYLERESDATLARAGSIDETT